MTSVTTVSSPCIAICRIDAASKLCIGCARTGLEIGSWAERSEEDRLALMAELPDRFARTPALQAARDAFEADRRTVSRDRDI